MRRLTKVRNQSGARNLNGRPIEGLFEIFIDEDRVDDLCSRAEHNKSKKATFGGVTVVYHPCDAERAGLLVHAGMGND